MSFAANRSALAPLTPTHWLESSVVSGADAVDSVDDEDEVPGTDDELFVAERDELVVLLVNEQPDISMPATSTTASNHR